VSEFVGIGGASVGLSSGAASVYTTV